MNGCKSCDFTGWEHYTDEKGAERVRGCACRQLSLEERLHLAGVPPMFQKLTLADVQQWEGEQFDETRKMASKLMACPIEDSFFFTGRVRCGKTSLACAFARRQLQESRRVIYTTELDLASKLKATFGSKPDQPNEQDVIDPLISTDCLVLDDCGIYANDDGAAGEWFYRTIFQLIDKRLVNMAQVVVVSNLDYDQLTARWDARVTERLREQCRSFSWEADEVTNE